MLSKGPWHVSVTAFSTASGERQPPFRMQFHVGNIQSRLSSFINLTCESSQCVRPVTNDFLKRMYVYVSGEDQGQSEDGLVPVMSGWKIHVCIYWYTAVLLCVLVCRMFCRHQVMMCLSFALWGFPTNLGCRVWMKIMGKQFLYPHVKKDLLPILRHYRPFFACAPEAITCAAWWGRHIHAHSASGYGVSCRGAWNPKCLQSALKIIITIATTCWALSLP